MVRTGVNRRWRQARSAGLELKLRIEPMEHRLDTMIETECFRIAQEALTNVVRHAKAQNVSVQLARKNGQLELSVRDDGIGFDVDTAEARAEQGASLGLVSIKERTTLAGGGAQIVSSPGEGTSLFSAG